MTTGSESQVLRQAVARVMRHVDRTQLLDILTGVIGVPSPTGNEAPLAEWIVRRLSDAGVTARTQALDAYQANAVATVAGGDGASLMLYAPLDTFTVGREDLDVPSAAPDMRPEMRPNAVVEGDVVTGLGAGNPKGHVAVVIAVMEAFVASGTTPAGEVLAGFGAGGMPSFAVPGAGQDGRENTGHGVGAAFLLERGCTTDYAVIAKPGWTVSHEEVGLVWIDVTVPGVHTYAGSRHRMPYSNAVALAGHVAVGLEDWLEGYARRHEHSTMTPQGVVSSIQGGSARLAASTPASVRLRLDLRITTEQTPPMVLREVREELRALGARLGVELHADLVAAIPASRTDPGSPVVRAAVRAFEAVDGAPHVLVGHNSGATDANVLRMRGVPTARVGMPKVPEHRLRRPVDFTLGMNAVDLVEMRRLAEVLVRTVLELPGCLGAPSGRDGRSGAQDGRTIHVPN